MRKEKIVTAGAPTRMDDHVHPFAQGWKVGDFVFTGGIAAEDPETGKMEVLRYVVVEDVGRCINPLTMHGQSVGGAAQGIGGAMLEELVYDAGGQLLSGSLMDYLLPTSQDIPDIETVITEDAPSPLNPLGVKGAGAGAILATGAALGNAVANALSPFGVQVNTMPLSPDNIRRWIVEAAASQ